MHTPPQNETSTNLPLWACRVRRKCTHGSDSSQHHYCVPLLSRVKWSWFFVSFFFFILKYLLVDLIPRFTTWTISHPPIHTTRHILLMRRLGQKKIKHSSGTQARMYKTWACIFIRSLLLPNTCTPQEFMPFQSSSDCLLSERRKVINF